MIFKGVHVPVVPNGAGVGRPLEPHLDIDVLLIHIEQIIQDYVALGLVQSHDATRHRPVDEQRLPARGRVNSHQGMNPLDVLGPFLRLLTLQVWMSRDIHRLLAVDDLAEVGGQLLIGGVAACPEGVTAHGRGRVDVKVRVASWLQLMDQICMPAGCASWVPEVGGPLCGHEIGPDDGHSWQTGDLRHLGLYSDISSCNLRAGERYISELT